MVNEASKGRKQAVARNRKASGRAMAVVPTVGHLGPSVEVAPKPRLPLVVVLE